MNFWRVGYDAFLSPEEEETEAATVPEDMTEEEEQESLGPLALSHNVYDEGDQKLDPMTRPRADTDMAATYSRGLEEGILLEYIKSKSEHDEHWLLADEENVRPLRRRYMSDDEAERLATAPR